MTPQDWERLTEIAKRAARGVAVEYPGIEVDDIEQEIMVHILERDRLFSADNYTDASLYRTFKEVGTRYAGMERYRFTFNSAQYVYLPSEVRQLFEAAYFDETKWEDVPGKGDYRESLAGGGIVVALWDLREAYDGLREGDRLVIRKRHFLGETLTTAEQKRYERAIDAVTRALNQRVVERDNARGDHDGPGSRRAMSNAESRRQLQGA